jgi:cytochrome b pre-mRNA-processing protein 3
MKALLDLFRRADRADPATVDALLSAIVAAGREPFWYRDHLVPDTPIGRFEMLALHMALVLRASRGLEGRERLLVQALTEEFFKDVDHSLRELGIGDGGVPKRMKKLAGMFYGRLDAYASALDAGDAKALAQALNRNIMPDGALADAEGFAQTVMQRAGAAQAAMTDGFAEGRLDFKRVAEAAA